MPAIVTQTDQTLFEMSFGVGTVTVTVAPGFMTASGKAKAGGLTICVAGDETQIIVPGCAYFTSTHSIPGVGILSVDSLTADQQAQKVKSGGKAVLLAAGKFNAKFQVSAPAQQPAAPSPIPDPMTSYAGFGEFKTTNLRAKAT